MKNSNLPDDLQSRYTLMSKDDKGKSENQPKHTSQYVNANSIHQMYLQSHGITPEKQEKTLKKLMNALDTMAKTGVPVRQG